MEFKKQANVRHLMGLVPGFSDIQVAVETPMNLTKKQQELLRAFEEEAEKAGDKSSPESAGFFAKMREFFEGKS